MAAAFAPPPSLVQYEAPLPVGEEGAVKPKAGAGAGKASEAHTEEILNSILPPRCVTTPHTLSLRSFVLAPRKWALAQQLGPWLL
jgi:hypothetical protein